MKNNISKVKKNECTGCMCCENVCPKKCITKEIDEEGFVFPKVDEQQCVNCSLCLKKCQAVANVEKTSIQKAYALQIKDTKSLKDSASGGIAYEISKYIITNGGVSYGAIFDDDFNVVHQRADSIKLLKKQQGSKYVQSDISEVYISLKADCESGKKVVFIGTPCQVAAIKKFLNKDYNNLLLVDLICHGVPSQSLFHKYLEYKKEKIKDGDIIDYQFRNKDNGWGTNYKIKTKNKIKKGTAMEEVYYSDFEEGFNYRESCYNCTYAINDRVGDITIGDYWGIDEHQVKDIFDYTKGVSCVLVNSLKGEKFLENILLNCNYIETKIEDIIKNNSNLREPAKRPSIRDEYYKSIDKIGMKFSKKLLLKKKSYYKSIIIGLIPKKIKKIIKRSLLKK